jgi:hypothetical protein
VREENIFLNGRNMAELDRFAFAHPSRNTERGGSFTLAAGTAPGNGNGNGKYPHQPPTLFSGWREIPFSLSIHNIAAIGMQNLA